MDINVVEYVKQKGWTYEPASGGEITVWPCPFCGDPRKGKFYINVKTGLYYCQLSTCERSGNWFTLLREQGDTIPIRPVFEDTEEDIKKIERFAKEHVRLQKAHAKLWENRNALEYLRGRGFNDKTIKDFLIGVKKDDNGRAWLSFPYVTDGVLKNCKYRTFDTEKRLFRRLPGGESTLYNEDYILGTTARKRILITEGETDALSAYSKEIPWVVGVTIGSRGINSQWIEQLDRFARIYICFDTDIEGKRGAHGLARRLGYERCLNVQLPIGIPDLNEYFHAGHSKSEFLTLLRHAQPFDVENIVTLRSAVRQVADEFRYKGEMDTGIHLPWKHIDRCMGGLLSGDLVVLSGIPGVGKTTFALNVAHNFAYTQGIPTLFFCLEMRPERLARKLMSLHLQKEQEYIKEEDVVKCYSDFKDYPLYFGYAYRDLTMEKVANTIREAVRRYGIGFVVFDHLHFLCRSINNMTNEVSVTIREFKTLAEDEGIPVCVIVHPKKVEGNRVPNMMDLRDSGLIPADADFILVCHRKRLRISGEEESEVIFDDNSLIRVEKARFDRGGDSWLTFDGAKSSYSEQTYK